jgi:phosphoribosylformimino-5-aminoimidazole carboxamide ribotide isomerase
MDLYPAIDIRDGTAVRLTQGDFGRQTEYGDPRRLAEGFAAAGARWLHVVDLDAAKAGRPVNRATVLAIASAVGIPVETGGGVRSAEDVAELLAGGVRRVILGTLAVEDPDQAAELVQAHPGRVAIGVDYRLDASGRTEVAVRGWEQGSSRTVGQLLDRFAGVAVDAAVITAIDRDGTLSGPDVAGLLEVLASTDLPVIASGGVAGVADVETLAALSAPAQGAGPPRRLAGVVAGKALVDGRMTVAEGVAACARFG